MDITRPLKNKNILISGAGVAGPALAYWLHRHGFAPTVLERAAALRDGGYAVDFRGEAHLTVLDRMGVLADVRREQTHMGVMWYVDGTGRRIASMPADVYSGDLEILRGDLVRILHAKTADRVEYVFDDSITSIAEEEDGVRVTFERSAPRRFDLVVGADGVHSNVRALAFGPERRFLREMGLHCAIFTTPNLLGLDRTGHIHNTPGRAVAVYSARRNTEARAMFYFTSPVPDHDRHDTGLQRKILAEAFAGAGWETSRLLEAMWEAPDFYFDSIGQVHVDGWSRGRTVLLGDAACCASPLSGMGTGLAMVGAYVLAGELAAAAGDHRVGFARYEEAMRGYARGCQRSADGVGAWMVPGNRFMTWFVHRSHRLLPYMPGKGLIARNIRKTANAITLKDYGL
ncbi:2-polyprenyl-6-methoxyphenol hydroxylase-like FAD-dependent oxidoreductase [Streptosporangium becharense]|uniref:2-polyprenyl-6-methoxyphenol hydroxylase-like FAD-dependent oxidoreductase n=1 Tax=Streptosporangium becharense TaxID=1816182 RepID=A0A7W9IE56_9ACTN|nr:FAD-dependent monooxygenase [Streptosporangium becharense]MBB2912304.1 2-polyprenyl-6-methoxyphenol hydroxylase-like FAD-dependent oxidoreductase [Streptosporangium becharense]MBB5818851.1 2-polyprenyl-6-methoxyphenol hydroxylase-like FAD-dependent oxidoreductase [Streptosporangium becharense]